MPESRSYNGAREARQVGNFFWHLERYFEALDIDDEEEKVQQTVANSRLTVQERKDDVFADELDDLIDDRVAYFTKWEVQWLKDLKGQVTEIQEELAACKNELTRATRHGCIAVQPIQKKMSERRSYNGAREARQVDKFFWHLEWYFEALHIDDEEEKVEMITMYLMDRDVFCWRRRYTDGCNVKTWEKFKHELKRQFYPESVKDMAMINLQWLRKKGSIRKYVKEYSSLMLEIPEMSQWVDTELRQREPHNLASAMAIVKRLEDFEQRERLKSPRHDRAKDRGDGRSKSGLPKATDDERIGDEGCHRHHKGKKKHGGSRKQGDSRDYKAHRGPKGRCFYGADPHYRKDCQHNEKMIMFLDKHKGSKGDSSSSDGEAPMGALQMADFNIINMDELGVVLGMDFMEKSSATFNPYCGVMMMVGKEGQPEWMIRLVSKDGANTRVGSQSHLDLTLSRLEASFLLH
ncbi:hypothetical protein RJ639_006764 [Escallonia herrerae]|uniref:Retrotransposon gag domain-containing protein n=1 Tax=Escallonia herrerae TaxID=1293975 RepID=A0AA88W015_9ASTE|nr:hypothetical protein RJ639_006764 [Escallonia herrerae]